MVVKVNYLLMVMLMSSKWFQGHPVADDYDDIDCNAYIKVIGKRYKVTRVMMMQEEPKRTLGSPDVYTTPITAMGCR